MKNSCFKIKFTFMNIQLQYVRCWVELRGQFHSWIILVKFRLLVYVYLQLFATAVQNDLGIAVKAEKAEGDRFENSRQVVFHHNSESRMRPPSTFFASHSSLSIKSLTFGVTDFVLQ